MSKEKEMLKIILANTNAIMEHFKIKDVVSSAKQSGKVARPSDKGTKSKSARPVQKNKKVI